eukprot:1941837-Rhodomonas_salina.1
MQGDDVTFFIENGACGAVFAASKPVFNSSERVCHVCGCIVAIFLDEQSVSGISKKKSMSLNLLPLVKPAPTAAGDKLRAEMGVVLGGGVHGKMLGDVYSSFICGIEFRLGNKLVVDEVLSVWEHGVNASKRKKKRVAVYLGADGMTMRKQFQTMMESKAIRDAVDVMERDPVMVEMLENSLAVLFQQFLGSACGKYSVNVILLFLFLHLGGKKAKAAVDAEMQKQKARGVGVGSTSALFWGEDEGGGYDGMILGAQVRHVKFCFMLYMIFFFTVVLGGGVAYVQSQVVNGKNNFRTVVGASALAGAQKLLGPLFGVVTPGVDVLYSFNHDFLNYFGSMIGLHELTVEARAANFISSNPGLFMAGGVAFEVGSIGYVYLLYRIFLNGLRSSANTAIEKETRRRNEVAADGLFADAVDHFQE